MTYTPIAKGTTNWDVPLNAALAQLDSGIATVTTTSLQTTNNLSDLTNIAQARTNLGLSSSVTAVGSSVRNVKDFGALGNGVADDTAAIQAAINAGGVTYFPSGTYITSTLQAKLGTTLQGVARSNYAYPVPDTTATIIKLKNGTNSHLIQGATGMNNVQIYNISFDGNKANNTSGDIIHLDDSTAQDTSWYICDSYFDNSPHDGIYVGTGRQAVKINRTWIMRSANNGVTLNGADSGLDTCLIGLSGAQGVFIGAWVTRLTDCDIWSSGSSGIDIATGVQMVTLTSCGIDRNNQQGIFVGGTATAIIVEGCLLHSNSQQTDNTYPNISMQSTGTLTVIGTTFGNDSLTNMPSNAIEIYSGLLHEFGNIVVTGAVRGGYIFNGGGTITNSFTGSISLPLTSQVNIGGSGSTASVAALRAVSTDPVMSARVTGDTVNRFSIDSTGLHQWGSGSASLDVSLGRGAANRLDITTSDLRVATAGRSVQVASGTNAKAGTVTTNGTTAVTVSTTAITANSVVVFGLKTQAGTAATTAPFMSAVTAGTSFQVKSSAGDTSTYNWIILDIV